MEAQEPVAHPEAAQAIGHPQLKPAFPPSDCRELSNVFHVILTGLPIREERHTEKERHTTHLDGDVKDARLRRLLVMCFLGKSISPHLSLLPSTPLKGAKIRHVYCTRLISPRVLFSTRFLFLEV